MSIIGIFFARALRDDLTSKWLGVTLIVSAVGISCYVVLVFVQWMGGRIPTYAALRAYKGLLNLGTVPMNSIAMTAVMAYLAAICLLTPNRLILIAGIYVFSICGLLTGSRAPLIVLLASSLVVLLLAQLRNKRFLPRIGAWVFALLLPLTFVMEVTTATPKQIARASENRWDVWIVGMQKFIEQPLLGYGFESWHDDFASRLPGKFDQIGHMVQAHVGGYHSVYVTLLAEQGLVGTLPTLALLGFLFYVSYRLAFSEGTTWHNGKFALLGATAILIRGTVEAAGLFGYNIEPYDYCAFIFLAIIVSRNSREEDWMLSRAAAMLEDTDSSMHETAFA